MWRNGWIHIFIAFLIALAALVVIRLHVAHGASLNDGTSAGRRLAEAWCSECHALDATSPGEFSRAPDFARIASRTSTTELSLKVFFRTNHRDMPNLIIAPDQADDLARFILSLKRS